MSGSTLPNIATAGTITGSELLYMVQNSADAKVLLSVLATFIATSLTGAQLANIDFSVLPSSDPGGGRLWLNGSVAGKGVLQVGS